MHSIDPDLHHARAIRGRRPAHVPSVVFTTVNLVASTAFAQGTEAVLGAVMHDVLLVLLWTAVVLGGSFLGFGAWTRSRVARRVLWSLGGALTGIAAMGWVALGWKTFADLASFGSIWDAEYRRIQVEHGVTELFGGGLALISWAVTWWFWRRKSRRRSYDIEQQ